MNPRRGPGQDVKIAAAKALAPPTGSRTGQPGMVGHRLRARDRVAPRRQLVAA